MRKHVLSTKKRASFRFSPLNPLLIPLCREHSVSAPGGLWAPARAELLTGHSAGADTVPTVWEPGKCSQ